MTTLRLDQITVDDRCQPRVVVDSRVVADYAAEMAEGATFPPLTVFHDGETYWLADGFHRRKAAQQAGLTEIDCEVRLGTMRDAALYAMGANATHGFRRNNDDKRRAVETLLRDMEWGGWTQDLIAKHCGVSTGFVSNVKQGLSLHGEEIPTMRTVERGGTTYVMDTAKIGHREPRVEPPTEEPPDDPDWWDAESAEKGLPPAPVSPAQAASSPAPAPAPERDWTEADAEVGALLRTALPALRRDPRAAAKATVATDEETARLLLRRSVEITLWVQDFSAELRRALT